MLRGRMVAAAIERERERSLERIRISRDRVLTEYARVAAIHEQTLFERLADSRVCDTATSIAMWSFLRRNEVSR